MEKTQVPELQKKLQVYELFWYFDKGILSFHHQNLMGYGKKEHNYIVFAIDYRSAKTLKALKFYKTQHSVSPINGIIKGYLTHILFKRNSC